MLSLLKLHDVDFVWLGLSGTEVDKFENDEFWQNKTFT